MGNIFEIKFDWDKIKRDSIEKIRLVMEKKPRNKETKLFQKGKKFPETSNMGKFIKENGKF